MERRRQPKPYYMTYPILKEIKEAEKEKRDWDYFRQLYGREIKQYLKEVKKMVDALEDKDSFIYHEYLDQNRLEEKTEEIVNRIGGGDRVNREMLRHLIMLLFYDEIYGRRNNL